MPPYASSRRLDRLTELHKRVRLLCIDKSPTGTHPVFHIPFHCHQSRSKRPFTTRPFVMAIQQITPPLESMSPSDGTVRKRVCKACDRCRLKKSKVWSILSPPRRPFTELVHFQCDGSSPCSRCKADNAICVFGERKKSHDKVYPKG